VDGRVNALQQQAVRSRSEPAHATQHRRAASMKRATCAAGKNTPLHGAAPPMCACHHRGSHGMKLCALQHAHDCNAMPARRTPPLHCCSPCPCPPTGRTHTHPQHLSAGQQQSLQGHRTQQAQPVRPQELMINACILQVVQHQVKRSSHQHESSLKNNSTSNPSLARTQPLAAHCATRQATLNE
jgi:hypothetical protein